MPSLIPYAVSDSPIHGRGLFAVRAIGQGERITAYMGERISKAESLRRRKAAAKKEVYTVSLDDTWDIDGDTPANDARLANHSCAPNCELVLAEETLWLTASRPIAEREELSFDYGFSLGECLWHPCRCGAKNCCGYILAEPERRLLRRFSKHRK